MRMKQLALAIGLIGVAGMVTAHADDQADQSQKVEKIEVTGSSIKRVAKEGALPVTVIKKEDIERTGATTTEELLNTITATSAVGGTSTAQNAGLSTFGEATVSLRGLGSNRTLVLVNGHRMANYATDGTSVDVNSIPLSAVERVEVLRDGASSVYGSDAVAGVINFILKKNYKGFEVSGYFGQPTRSGGGSEDKAGFVLGVGDMESTRYNLIVSGDFSHDQALYSGDRNFAAKGWSTNGFDNSATPSGRLYAPWVIGQPFNNQNFQLNGDNPLAANNQCAQNGSLFDPNYGTCRYDPTPLVPITPQVDRANLSANFRLQLAGNNEFYSEAVFTHTKTVLSEQPSPYSPIFLGTDNAFNNSGIEQSVLLNPANPVYQSIVVPYLQSSGNAQFIGQPIGVSYRAFEGGNRVHTDTADQYHIVLGAKGGIGDYDYDVNYFYNESRVKEDTNDGYQLQTKLVQVLNNSLTFNPFVLNQDPTLAAQIRGTNYNGNIADSKLSNDGIDGKITGSLAELPAGPLGFAVGAGIHDEKLTQNFSAAAQSGDVSGYGASYIPYSVSRKSQSVYGELNVPIVSKLEAGLAVRTDHYETVGSTTNPKFDLRWQPMSQLLLRASWGKGFRAPSLPELYTPQVESSTSQFTDPVTGQSAQFNQLTGGNPNLKPERSTQSSIGLVVEPIRTLSVGVDLFQVKVTDPILVLSDSYIVSQAAAGRPYFVNLVQRNSVGSIVLIQNVNQNGGRLDVEGADLDVKWRVGKYAFGTVDVNLNGSYVSKYDETDPSGFTQASVAKTADANGNALNAVQNGGIILRWKHELTASVTNPTWSASLTQNYQSGYADYPNADATSSPHHVGAFSTYDIQGSYTGIKSLKINLGVKNVLDRDPPVSNAGVNLGFFQSGYDPSYYDGRARFVYLSGEYKFW